jgi:hypothetical protein
MEIHAAEPLALDPSPFEFQIVTAKLKNYISPGSDEIPTELNKAGAETLQLRIQKLFNSI